MAIVTKNSEFRFTGWHMLTCMIAFFGVIIVVNFTMASFASKSWTGLVVKNSYVASQKFNDELAVAEAQQARGWRSQVAYENGELVFQLFDKSGKAVTKRLVPMVALTLRSAVGDLATTFRGNNRFSPFHIQGAEVHGNRLEV